MNGIWFFGLSGVGKSFASDYLNKKIKRSIKIDGDQVRKFISYDLDYTLRDRQEQIRRVCGIARFMVFSGFFPIVSTVYMNNKILKECKKNNIKVLQIKRNFEQIKNKSIYKKK